jgi:hypothetical protein
VAPVCMKRVKASYHTCIKSLFCYARRDSVTGILLDLGLPSFDIIMSNARATFNIIGALNVKIIL